MSVTEAARKITNLCNFIDYHIQEDMEDDEDQLWQIEGILDHKVTCQGRPKVLVKWTSGDQNTWEFPSIIKQDNPLVCSEYIYANRLHDKKWQFK